jgi:hypothetical protein
MGHHYKAKIGQPIKNLEGLRKFLNHWSRKKYEEIDNATVYMYCGPLKHPAFSEKPYHYMIEIKKENKQDFPFVPEQVIDKLI